jgi:hypothetical protein
MVVALGADHASESFVSEQMRTCLNCNWHGQNESNRILLRSIKASVETDETGPQQRIAASFQAS